MGNNDSTSIVIIGAGVLGLSAAVTIQSRHPQKSITIVAAELPSLPSTWDDTSSHAATPAGASGNVPSSSTKNPTFTNKLKGRPSADYASMWAGAHYRPIPRSTRQLEQEFDLAVRTSQVMLDIARHVPADECGVATMPAVELLERPGDVELAMKTGDVYAGKDDEFRILTETELTAYDPSSARGTTKWGCQYMSYCVNVHVYCVWLLETFLRYGGKVVQKRLHTLKDVFDVGLPGLNGRRLVVNCSGRNFDTDPAMKIIRGQTVLVANQYHRTITRQNSDGSWAFLIPRPGGAGTIVGGTKEIADTETAPRSLARTKLLENSIKYFPDFVADIAGFRVLNDNVGRRPWREGGLRIEAETFRPDQTVIHGYGAGGRGYEVSWGVAEKLADLIADRLESWARAKL